VLAMMLHCARRLDLAVGRRSTGRWAAEDFYTSRVPPVELSRSTVGIVGFGGIGREVARRVAALGARVIAVKRTPPVEGEANMKPVGGGEAMGSRIGIVHGPTGLDAVMRESDYVAARSPRRDLTELLDSVVMNLAAFSGSAMEAMTRGHGWRLLDIGRRLERALDVAALMQAGLAAPAADERSRIELLLEAADSAITYRSRYMTSLQADLTIDLLLVDDANPRAIAFQLERLKDHVANLPSGPNTVRLSRESRLVTDALAAVELAELEQLSAVENGRRTALSELLKRIAKDLESLSEALTQDYLTHAKPSRHLAAQ